METTTTPTTLAPLPAGAYLVATRVADREDYTYTPAETLRLWPVMDATLVTSLSQGGYPSHGAYTWSLVTPASYRLVSGEADILAHREQGSAALYSHASSGVIGTYADMVRTNRDRDCLRPVLAGY